MDSLLAAAARALAVGDALGALQHVALRDDPPALALRGIALAQLSDYTPARALLRRAARGFGARQPLARARCIVAEAEVALALREVGAASRTLEQAAALLAQRGDRANAWLARLIAVRRQVLLGRIPAARAALQELDETALPAPLAAIAALAGAETALRTLRTEDARAALARAAAAAERAGIPALRAEVAEVRAALDRTAARLVHAGHESPLRLSEVERLIGSGTLVVDACRRALRAGDFRLDLARRPVLFALLRALAQAWPGDVERNALITQVFRTRRPDDTLRARLRVEIGRLRRLVAPQLRIDASARGFLLTPRDGRGVVVLLPPIDSEQAALLALLADGAAWSTSALALALDASQRTVQRALAELEQAGQVRALGRARAQRWLAPPLTGFTTVLLLPAALPPE